MLNFKMTSDISDAIHSMWVAHNSHTAHLTKNSNQTSDADFVHDAYEGEYLFSELDDIVSTWGPETELNFDELTRVFTTYLKHSRPDKSVETLHLFSTVFKLIASILEHKVFVQQQYKLYKTIIDVVGSTKDDEWYKILSGKTD